MHVNRTRNTDSPIVYSPLHKIVPIMKRLPKPSQLLLGLHFLLWYKSLFKFTYNSTQFKVVQSELLKFLTSFLEQCTSNV